MTAPDPNVTPSDDRAEVLRVRLKTPPRVPRFAYALSVLFAMTSVMLWGQAALDAGGAPLLLVLAAMGGIVPLVLAATREPPGTPVVELGPDRLWLPRTAELAETMVLTYREIDALFMRPGPAGFIWVGTPNATFMYPTRRFVRPEDAERLHAALRARIEARLPDGPERLAAFEHAAQAALAAYRRPLFATMGLVAAIVIGTIVTTVLRYFDVFNLVHVGALIPALVLEHGQWWRLGTAAWLSLPADGLVAATTVGVFGMMVERLFGATHVLATAAASVAVGAVMTLLSSTGISFGATPIAVGLFAGLAFVAQARPALLPVGFRPPGVWWVVTGLLLGSLIFMLSNQHSSMQFGGAVAGVVVTALRLREDTRLPLQGPAPAGLRLAALVGIVASVGCWALAAENTRGPAEAEQTTLLTLARDEGWGSHPIWNEMAWRVATAPNPEEGDLALAGVLVERAVARADALEGELQSTFRRMYVDTLATVRFRQQRLDDAVRLERELVAENGNVVYATQLARFLARRVMVGSSTVTEGLPAMELRHAPEEGFGLVVKGTVSAPTIVWGVVRNGAQVHGLVRLTLTPATPEEKIVWLQAKGTAPQWPADVRLLVADAQPGEAEWTTWGVNDEYLKLP